MANETTCLKCGEPLTGDARGGFCPKCLFAQATAGDSDDPSLASQLEPSSAAAAKASGSSDHASASTGTELPLPRAFGDYELLEEIARGGMGVVFKARDRGHQNSLSDGEFSPDGRRLISSSWDGSVRVFRGDRVGRKAQTGA